VNYRLEQPYQHAAFFATHLTQETMWKPEEKLALLDRSSRFSLSNQNSTDPSFFKTNLDITATSLQEYITLLLSRMHIETLVHGNMLKDVRCLSPRAEFAETNFL
jgi:insulysin